MLVRLVQVTVAVLFLCGQVWPQNEEDDYYEEAQQHFATDFESECQFDEAEDTTGPNQGEQYMNHDALLRSRRRRPLNAPCIDAPVAINISFAIGDTAELTCTVRQLGEHKVTWLKQGELFPISVDWRLFTPNGRFALLRNGNTTKKTPHWNIRIQNVQPDDAGTYSCQLNTHPIKAKRIYLHIEESSFQQEKQVKQHQTNETWSSLSEQQQQQQKTGTRGRQKSGNSRKQVVTAQPAIATDSSNDSPPRQRNQNNQNNNNQEQSSQTAPNAGPSVQIEGTVNVDLGSPIRLTCTALSKHGYPPSSISWYHNSVKVTATRRVGNASRSLQIWASAKSNQLVSELSVLAARSTDQGRYTCRTPESSAFVDVQVFRETEENNYSQYISPSTAEQAASNNNNKLEGSSSDSLQAQAALYWNAYNSASSFRPASLQLLLFTLLLLLFVFF